MTTTPPPNVPPTQPSPPQAPPEIEQNKDARTMGMLCYLLCILTGFIGPLVIWLIKKEEMSFVKDQGKEVLNWIITVVIAAIALVVITIVLVMITPFFACLTYVVYMAVIVCNLVFCIIGAIKANQGIRYRFPFALRLIK